MSTMINPYCTLVEFKAYMTPPQQTLNLAPLDDAVIESMIETASRRVDNLVGMGRVFYPSVRTLYFDHPRGRDIWFDEDLLEVISFTNGDSTAIASTEYLTRPYNRTPFYELAIKYTSTVTWELSTTGSDERVLTLVAIGGYRQDYATRGWKVAGTLGAAISTTTTLTATMTAGHTLQPGGGQIVRIDNEICNVASTDATTLTVVSRGDNGSTAATHLNGATVYVWQFQDEITALTLEVARMMYRSRFGENVETTAITTPAGVVVNPRSLPVWAQEVITRYRKTV